VTARLALARLPGMLSDLVREAFVGDTRVAVETLPVAAGESMADAVSRAEPDVLILGQEGQPTEESYALLLSHPRLVLLGLAVDGRSAWLCELLPSARPLGEASAAVLQDAVHEALDRRRL
jgi:hypothetical protein